MRNHAFEQRKCYHGIEFSPFDTVNGRYREGPRTRAESGKNAPARSERRSVQVINAIYPMRIRYRSSLSYSLRSAAKLKSSYRLAQPKL